MKRLTSKLTQCKQWILSVVMQRLLIFKISLLEIHLNPKYAWIGITILTTDNMVKEYSLFTIAYHNFDKCLILNICFISKKWFF
jgi:hypothetical protein